jgi:excisionase family DNA binding protein
MLTFDHDKLSTGIQPLTVTISEAVRLSGLSRSELYRQLSAGRIRACKSGSRTLILWASLKAYVEALPEAEFRAPKAAGKETAPGASAPGRRIVKSYVDTNDIARSVDRFKRCAE